MPKGEQKEAAVRLKDVAILPIGFAESLMHQIFATAKEMQMVEMWLFSLFTQKYHQRRNGRDGKALGFPRSLCQLSDRRSEIQVCFRMMAEDFLDAKFQNMIVRG